MPKTQDQGIQSWLLSPTSKPPLPPLALLAGCRLRSSACRIWPRSRMVRVIGEGRNHWACVYDRDLADLGINRAMIGRLAHEAAWGAK